MPVVRVLDHDGSRQRLVIIIGGAERGQDLRRAEHAPLRPHLPDLDTPDHRGSRRLVQEHVGISIRDDLLPGTGADQQAEQIAHGPAGYEQRGLLAHPSGCRLLQPVDGGVVTEDVVAERRTGHGPEHVRGGERHRVGPKVNTAHHNSLPHGGSSAIHPGAAGPEDFTGSRDRSPYNPRAGAAAVRLLRGTPVPELP